MPVDYIRVGHPERKFEGRILMVKSYGNVSKALKLQQDYFGNNSNYIFEKYSSILITVFARVINTKEA